MLNFYGEKCPVCNKAFEEGDDIVVCPICGTPHHRDCYKIKNQCANEDKHKDDFVWQPSNKPKQEKKSSTPKQASASSPSDKSQAMTPGQIFANQIGLPSDSQSKSSEEMQGEEIDGVEAKYLAFYIRKNPTYFLRKWFRNRDKKFFVSFNWSAFFFSFVYFYYRKMYRVGSLFLLGIVLSFIPTFTLAGSIMPQIAPYVNELLINPSLISTIAIDFTGLESLVALANMCSKIPFILTVIGALVFDSLYKKRAVKETDKILKSGGDAKMLLIKGGVSLVNALFIICFVIFMFYFLMQTIAVGMN